MSALFRKLNLKDQRAIVVLDAPSSLEPELAALEARGVRVQRTVAEAGVAFALAFVTTQVALDAAAAALTAHAVGDAVLWFAYPKRTSRRPDVALHRDRGWEALGRAGFEGVRQVAIDADWTALRFRRVAYVRTLTRDPARAATPEGKARTRPAPR